jgi:hypothetical protein
LESWCLKGEERMKIEKFVEKVKRKVEVKIALGMKGLEVTTKKPSNSHEASMNLTAPKSYQFLWNF